jgi:O-antigen/teichoic acid export membrane protein
MRKTAQTSGESSAGSVRVLSARTALATIGGQSVSKFAITLIGLVSTAILTRHLGADGYAHLATSLSLYAMFAFILDPGLTPVLVRRITSREPVPKPRRTLAIRLALGFVVFATTAAIGTFLSGWAAAAVAVVIAFQAMPRAVILNAAPWLQADHRLHRQSIAEVGFAAAALCMLLVAANIGAPAAVLAFLPYVSPALGVAGMAFLFARSARGTASEEQDLRQFVGSVFRETAPIAGAVALISLYTRVDVVFVNAADSADQVARYLLSWRLVEQSLFFAGVVGAAAMPLFVSRSAQRHPAEDATVHAALVAVAAVAAIGALMTIALASPLMWVLGGASFEPGAILLRLLAPAIPALFVNFLLGSLWIGRGEGRKYLKFNALGLLFNLAGNAFFTMRYGVEAAARLSWMTEVLVVAMAARPLLVSSARGKATGAKLVVGLLLVTAGSELTANGLVGPWVAAPLAAVVVSLAGRELIGFAKLLRMGRQRESR